MTSPSMVCPLILAINPQLARQPFEVKALCVLPEIWWGSDSFPPRATFSEVQNT